MIDAGRKPPDHGVVTPPEALRFALSRAAQDIVRVPITGGEVADIRVTLGGMAAALPPNGLWVLLQGPGQARGLICADPSLLAAFVQGLTTGRVSGVQVAERAPTQTDAVLVRRVLGCILDALVARLEGHESVDWAQGFQPRDRITDPARLPHLLPDVAYRALSMDVDIADGLRAGRLVLLLPRKETGPRTPQGDDDARAGFTEALRRTLRWAPVELSAVLHRLQLPLSDVTDLREDMVLTLPRSALGNVTLIGCDGSVVARGKLGQSGGQRAVKLQDLSCSDAWASDEVPDEDPATDTEADTEAGALTVAPRGKEA